MLRLNAAMRLLLVGILASAFATPGRTQTLPPPPPPGQTSTLTTPVDDYKRTTTTCQTDARRNTVCSTSEWEAPRPYVPSPQELKELAREKAAREKAWSERCKPETYVDRQGIIRHRYSAPNCDLPALSVGH
jgi:hypothetical protein